MKLCKDCRFYSANNAIPSAPVDLCHHNPTVRMDVVYGKLTAYRDCRKYRLDFTEVGSHPIHGNCGQEGRFWEAKPQMRSPKWRWGDAIPV